MKRITSCILILSMMLSMSTSAFAVNCSESMVFSTEDMIFKGEESMEISDGVDGIALESYQSSYIDWLYSKNRIPNYLESHFEEDVTYIEVIKGFSELRDLDFNVDGAFIYSTEEKIFLFTDSTDYALVEDDDYLNQLSDLSSDLIDEYAVTEVYLNYKSISSYSYSLLSPSDSVTLSDLLKVYMYVNGIYTDTKLFNWLGLDNYKSFLYSEERESYVLSLILPDYYSELPLDTVLSVEDYMIILNSFYDYFNIYTEIEDIGYYGTTKLLYISDWIHIFNYMYENEVYSIVLDLGIANEEVSNESDLYTSYWTACSEAYSYFESAYPAYAYLISRISTYISYYEGTDSYYLWITLNENYKVLYNEVKTDTRLFPSEISDIVNETGDFSTIDTHLLVVDSVEKEKETYFEYTGIEVPDDMTLIAYKLNMTHTLSLEWYQKLFKNRTMENMSESEMAWCIYNYVMSKVDYDNNYTTSPTNDCYTAYAGLLFGKTVCCGYSGIFQLLCNYAGIECYGVTGILDSYEFRHSWQYYYVDGGWYYGDCTWDDNHRNTNIYWKKTEMAGRVLDEFILLIQNEV